MHLENIKVLYADDELEIRELMKSILGDEVKELYIAKDGDEAYEIYKNKKPDIMLLDINMPNCNGLQFANKVRQTDHSTRIIMITAYSDTKNLLSAAELKLTKYLVKPFSTEELFNSLNLALEESLNFKVTNKKNIHLKNNFTWDEEAQILLDNANEINLTPKERKILHILFSNINSTITYDTLFIEVWDDFENYSIDTLKTMMKNIRRKLPKDTITNVYATGYKVII